jgi:hypothetical protein
MALIEQRLMQLEQENEWWMDWKKDQHNKLVNPETRTVIRNENNNIDTDLAESLENSLIL